MSKKGLGDELIETWNQDRSLDNFNPRDLGFSQHTLCYICNLIFESCLANDVNDGSEAFDVVIHVLKDSLNIEVEGAEAAAVIGLRWRSAMMTGQWSAEVLDYEPTDHEREIFKVPAKPRNGSPDCREMLSLPMRRANTSRHCVRH